MVEMTDHPREDDDDEETWRMISRLVKGGLFGKMAGIGIHSQNEGGSQEAKWMIDGEEDEKQCFLRTVEVAAQIWQVATGKDHRGEARHVGTRMIPIIAKNGMSQTIQYLHSTRTEWNHQRRVDFGGGGGGGGIKTRHKNKQRLE